MIYKEHYIELWVNGNKVELENQKSVSMRFNNVLFDPTKISSNQAEYSFEFEVPCTPKNNIIFDYANNLSKTNKFHQRYKAEVYADGTVIFSGTITINGVKDGMYNLNLVSVKVYSLEDIFGDLTMNKIKNYKIDFSGATSINSYNSQLNPDVVFPLISYGVFEKEPEVKDEVANEYTSKFDLDEWNQWYVESFPPSHKMLTTLRKCFESVKTTTGEDYVLGGDVFEDQFLGEVYMSVNLADGQVPTYNLGNPLFGKVSMNLSWQTPSSGSIFTQDLKFPYCGIGGRYDIDKQQMVEREWNFPSIQVYNTMSTAEGNTTLTVSEKTYMYHPGNSLIVIPADGWYRISLDAMATLNPYQSGFTAAQHCRESLNNYNIEERDVDIPVDFKTSMPFELQLVRNYDDNIELISGKNKFFNRYGYPADNTKFGISNRINVTTCFPHEKLGTNWIMGGFINDTTVPPTEINDLGKSNLSSRLTNPNMTGDSLYVYDSTLGYMYKDDTYMMYDQAVSKAFIAGFTSIGNDNGGGCAAIMRNGYSWSKTAEEKNDVIYYQPGYTRATTTSPIIGVDWDNIIYTDTEYNKNDYLEAPTQGTFSQTDSITTFDGQTIKNQRFIGNIYCTVWLNRNDVINLMAIQRDYSTTAGIQRRYSVACIANLTIEAISNKSRYEMDRKPYTYHTPTMYDKQLNLAEFFNSEKKVSEWVQNIADAFNLEILQNGKYVEINKRKKINTDAISVVDIDDRVNSADAEAKAIDYPKSMAVKYKIDDDEWGFERSAVINGGGQESVLDDEDWKKLADSGYTVITLNDDSYVTSTSDKNLQFSYTWYQNFNWYAVNSAYTRTSDSAVMLRIPCISKFTYMIDGYDYEESMKHDGHGLSQRFWFRPRGTGCYVWTRTYPAEQIWLYETTNTLTNYQNLYFNLSYKDTERSLLTEYFNINAYLASNYVKLDVYLSPEEYNRIKNGALVGFDSDLYLPVEISGYDPSGNNTTELKLMKKVI